MTANRVLVVEDDPALRILMLRTLRENGYEATGVGDGVEMGRSLEAGAFDLVVLDIMLPGGNGLDLCRALRARSAIPIIIVSARGEEFFDVRRRQISRGRPKRFCQDPYCQRARKRGNVRGISLKEILANEPRGERVEADLEFEKVPRS